MFDLLDRVQCKKCGNDMRLHTAEPMDHTIRGEFRCVEAKCGHTFDFEMPRRRSAKARRERVEHRA